MKRNMMSALLVSAFLTGLLSNAAFSYGSNCERVKGTGHTFATGPRVFQGTASVAGDGQTVNVAVTTTLLGQPTATEDGTLLAATSHTFVFPDGSTFTTIDRAVLSPTDTPGLYRINTDASIDRGTGDYANACGKLSIHGTIDLFGGEVVWRYTGQLCSCS
jgi:hypothetical protein